jgi:hypothetical protein
MPVKPAYSTVKLFSNARQMPNEIGIAAAMSNSNISG